MILVWEFGQKARFWKKVYPIGSEKNEDLVFKGCVLCLLLGASLAQEHALDFLDVFNISSAALAYRFPLYYPVYRLSCSFLYLEFFDKQVEQRRLYLEYVLQSQ